MLVIVTKASLSKDRVHQISIEMEELKKFIKEMDDQIVMLMNQLEKKNIPTKITKRVKNLSSNNVHQDLLKSQDALKSSKNKSNMIE
jgi:arsenate reductase-like glutaredoxin family protein